MVQAVNVPFLPGHVMRDVRQTNHARPQTLVYKLDCASDTLTTPQVPLEEGTLNRLQNPAWRVEASQNSFQKTELASTQNQSKLANEPAWLKHDRQVLRFYAYFQEAVVESPLENARTRNCVLCYFLEDGTMQINEPKVENSGIWPQGPMMKRHRIPKGDGTFFSPEDLKQGATVVVYSRAFRIVGCDEFTRWFYEQAGMDLGEAEDVPLDAFFENSIWKKENTVAKVGFPREVMQQKEYTELKLGGNRRNNSLQQFLENDRKVLRFYAYWDDPTRYGSRMYFVVHFFLADDTVEINNSHARNSGRDPYPVFFTRSKLQKKPTITNTPGMIEAEPDYIMPSDLIIGSTFEVYGREFHLYDCDDATKEFYKSYMGITVQPQPAPVEEKVHLTLSYPPHTGFGNEDDSLGSCLHLRPKPPPQDLVKMMTNSDRLLRYEGRFANNQPEDAHRRVIIGIFLANDTVAVWEVRSRNSGQVEGKFAERGKKKNPATGKWFVPDDFYVGAVVSISAQPFQILRADEYTLKYMEQNPAVYPRSSYNHCLERIYGLKDATSPDTPSMSPEQFRAYVHDAIGVLLDDQEIITILRHRCYQESADIDVAQVLEDIKAGGV